MPTKQIFEDYINGLLKCTFGFEVPMEISFEKRGWVYIVLDCSFTQKSILLGGRSENYYAIKQLISTFAHRNGLASFFCIKRDDEQTEKKLPSFTTTQDVINSTDRENDEGNTYF